MDRIKRLFDYILSFANNLDFEIGGIIRHFWLWYPIVEVVLLLRNFLQEFLGNFWSFSPKIKNDKKGVVDLGANKTDVLIGQ